MIHYKSNIFIFYVDYNEHSQVWVTNAQRIYWESSQLNILNP